MVDFCYADMELYPEFEDIVSHWFDEYVFDEDDEGAEFRRNFYYRLITNAPNMFHVLFRCIGRGNDIPALYSDIRNVLDDILNGPNHF